MKARDYRVRKKSLARLGFGNYIAYLHSTLWAMIRRKVFERDNYKCKCGERCAQAHHRSYDLDTMAGSNIDKIVSVCEPCHKAAHRKERRNSDNRKAVSRARRQAARAEQE